MTVPESSASMSAVLTALATIKVFASAKRIFTASTAV